MEFFVHHTGQKHLYEMGWILDEELPSIHEHSWITLVFMVHPRTEKTIASFGLKFKGFELI